MAADARGADLTKVFIPVTGMVAFGPDSSTVPTSSQIAAPGYVIPGTMKKLGLVKTDGGPEWSGDPSGDAIDFWQDGYSLNSGEVDAEVTITLAQTDPIVRELTAGVAPDANGVIDVALASNNNVYALFVEEVSKTLDVRRRFIPNATVKSVKEDKSERGTPLGYAVTFNINRSDKIGQAHYREVILTGSAAVTTKTGWTVTVSGTPTSGTYRLVLNGASTANLAYNATNTDIAAALNALAGVTGLTGITVTGTGTFTVTLPSAGNLAAGTIALTGGSSPTVTVA